ALPPAAAEVAREWAALFDEGDGLPGGRLAVAAQRDSAPQQRALAQADIEALLRLALADDDPRLAGRGPAVVGDGDEVRLVRVDVQAVRAVGPGARHAAVVTGGAAAALDLQEDPRGGPAVGQRDLAADRHVAQQARDQRPVRLAGVEMGP